MRVFIAGIMQGSRTDGGIDAQDYRREIAQLLRCHVPGVEVLDPFRDVECLPGGQARIYHLATGG